MRKEIHWRQKVRVKWVKEGIAIQSFFIKWLVAGEIRKERLPTCGVIVPSRPMLERLIAETLC